MRGCCAAVPTGVAAQTGSKMDLADRAILLKSVVTWCLAHRYKVLSLLLTLFVTSGCSSLWPRRESPLPDVLSRGDFAKAIGRLRSGFVWDQTQVGGGSDQPGLCLVDASAHAMNHAARIDELRINERKMTP